MVDRLREKESSGRNKTCGDKERKVNKKRLRLKEEKLNEETITKVFFGDVLLVSQKTDRLFQR